jgi:hypothetical protein
MTSNNEEIIRHSFSTIEEIIRHSFSTIKVITVSLCILIAVVEIVHHIGLFIPQRSLPQAGSSEQRWTVGSHISSQPSLLSSGQLPAVSSVADQSRRDVQPESTIGKEPNFPNEKDLEEAFLLEIQKFLATQPHEFSSEALELEEVQTKLVRIGQETWSARSTFTVKTCEGAIQKFIAFGTVTCVNGQLQVTLRQLVRRSEDLGQPVPPVSNSTEVEERENTEVYEDSRSHECGGEPILKRDFDGFRHLYELQRQFDTDGHHPALVKIAQEFARDLFPLSGCCYPIETKTVFDGENIYIVMRVLIKGLFGAYKAEFRFVAAGHRNDRSLRLVRLDELNRANRHELWGPSQSRILLEQVLTLLQNGPEASQSIPQ